jgi:predicted transcriptional regulator
MAEELRTEVELMKRDFNSLNHMTERLDIAIDKLSEVADGMNRILVVHELKLENHEKQISLWNTQYEGLHERINTSRKEFTDDLTKGREMIIAKMADLDAVQCKTLEGISARVNQLERWKYLMVGGAVVLGFIISKMPVINNLLN